LAPHRGDGRRRAPRQTGSGDPAAVMPLDPMIGPQSPIAPPLRCRWEPPTAIGEVLFTAAYEGPPGCVHGGVIAAAFDQVFNVANLMLGTAGPTASLQLHYRRPTPLQVPLRFEAWQDRVEGRRVYTRGRLLVGDRTTVEAEGLFILVPVGRIRRMMERDPDDADPATWVAAAACRSRSGSPTRPRATRRTGTPGWAGPCARRGRAACATP